MSTLLDFLRVPVYYIALGAVPAALFAAIAVAIRMYRHMPPSAAVRRSVAEAAFLLLTVAIVILAVHPNEGVEAGAPNLVPLRGLFAVRSASDLLIAIVNLAGNAAIFAVWAIALRLLVLAMRLWPCALIALAYSLGLEIVQSLFIEGRTGDVDDVIANVLGAACGFGLLTGVRRLSRDRSGPSASASAPGSASNP